MAFCVTMLVIPACSKNDTNLNVPEVSKMEDMTSAVSKLIQVGLTLPDDATFNDFCTATKSIDLSHLVDPIIENGLRCEDKKHFSLPNEWKIKIENAIVSENLDDLDIVLSEYYNSSDFLLLSNSTQNNLQERFNSIKEIRMTIAKAIYSEHMHLRMSPGDRMIWSEACKKMTPEMAKKLISASMIPISIIGGVPGVAISTVWSLINLIK